MVEISVSEIINAVGGKILFGNDIKINSVTTDSREVSNDLFIAIKGENFDGNNFAKGFLENGGNCVIVEKEIEEVFGKTAIFVESTAKALLDLGRYIRNKVGCFVVGITGSVGKTSTKDMIYSVISKHKSTLKTLGNKNNEIGVPLTLFRLNNDVEAAVVEMGMSHFGEISRLTNSAKPNVAVITNIGTAHIGNLGSREGILKAKLEIAEGLDDNGVLILNGDDEYLKTVKGKTEKRVIYFGINNKEADIAAYNITSTDNTSEFDVLINNKEYHFIINIVGEHHIYNALSAICVGIILGEKPENMILGVSEYQSEGLRQKEVVVNNIKIIEDCYNASTVSMDSSMDVLIKTAKGERTIAVFGDILEQGDFAEEMHRSVGKSAYNKGIDIIVAIGEHSKYIVEEAKNNGHKNAVWFSNNDDALSYLIKTVCEKDTVSFKGSRGMKLETVAEALISALNERND